MRVLFAICFATGAWSRVCWRSTRSAPRSIARRAITERYRERKSKGGTNEVLEGVDDRGGEFEIDVDESTFARASVGDRVVITRALLTGRVVDVDGPGWSDGGSSWKMWVWSVFGGIALLVLVWSLRTTAKNTLPNADPEQRRKHFTRMALWALAAVVGVTGWVFYERSDANADAGGADPGTVTTAVAVEECTGISQRVSMWVPTVVADGQATTSDLNLIVQIVQASEPGCTRGEIESSICDEMEQRSLCRPPRSSSCRPSLCADR